MLWQCEHEKHGAVGDESHIPKALKTMKFPFFKLTNIWVKTGCFMKNRLAACIWSKFLYFYCLGTKMNDFKLNVGGSFLTVQSLDS